MYKFRINCSFFLVEPIDNDYQYNCQNVLDVRGSRVWRSIEESNGHLLFHIGPLKSPAELLEGYHLVIVSVRFNDCSFSNTRQLFLTGIPKEKLFYYLLVIQRKILYTHIFIGLICIYVFVKWNYFLLTNFKSFN